jgi:exopolysaccharide biosynthesis operon protein EpsL
MPNARVRPLALVLCTLFALPAGAGPDDALHLYAGLAYGHDDNLLRVPDDQPPFEGTRADSWWQGEGGLIFDKTYGRQRISAVAKLSKYDFDHFKQLNYDGKDLQATWFWQLGNHLEGKVGTTYEQVLAPYTDFQSSERNLRRTRTKFAEGAWGFHSSWRVRTGFQRDEYDYELLAQRYNNRTEDTSEVELDYLPSSGSTVGLVARRVRGTYPYPRPVGAGFVNDDFTQDELKARVLWLATGSTSFDALVGYTRREQPSFGPGTTSGVAGKVKATYQPRGKMTWNAAIWRDFAPLESTVVSYTLNKGASVGALWDATDRIKVNADAVYERRHYNARATAAGLGDLRDSIRTGSLSATWSPRPTVHVSAGFAHQARSGSVVLGTGSFSSNSVTLSASAQF